MNYIVENKTAKAILDLRNGRFKAFSNENPQKVNEAMRARFNEILPTPNAMGRYKYRDLMKSLPAAFSIIEEVIDVAVNEAYRSNPFYREVVEVRNLALADKNDFVVKDNSWLSVNKFAGGTWDTDRERLIGGKKFTVDTEWFYVHAFDDFERFRTGAITIEEMTNQLTEAFVRHIDSLIAVAFNGAGNNLPSQFNITGPLTTADTKELILRVKTAARKNVKIYGTELAISQLNNLAEVKYSEEMNNEVYSTGRLGKWMGTPIVEIPQAFEYGTYDWAVDNECLFVLPDGIKPIKVVDEGETLSRELDEKDTHDQTIDYQLQRKLGCAAVFGEMFGKYSIE